MFCLGSEAVKAEITYIHLDTTWIQQRPNTNSLRAPESRPHQTYTRQAIAFNLPTHLTQTPQS
jgi:hypothetical protein